MRKEAYMVLAGHIDDRNQLWVSISVSGVTGKQTVDAQIDTGFTGELALPLQIAIPLGLQLGGLTDVTYAKGKPVPEMLFTGQIDWGTTNRTINTIMVLDTDVPLIGGGLLYGYIMLVDFDKKELIIKEPGVDEPSPSTSPSQSPSPSPSPSPSEAESSKMEKKRKK